MAAYLLAVAILFCIQVRNCGLPWWGSCLGSTPHRQFSARQGGGNRLNLLFSQGNQ